MKSLPKSVEQSQRSRSGRSLGWIPWVLLVAVLAGDARSQTPDSFNPGANDTVFATVVQPDGRVVVGGSFSMMDGHIQNYLARLTPDGRSDREFNPVTAGVAGSGFQVLALAIQNDGKILLGGSFLGLGGQGRYNLGRLNPDGSLDPTFITGTDGNVKCLVSQADGSTLVSGNFSMLGGQPRSRIGRLQPDGSLDPTFNPGANGPILSMVVQTNGQILVGGWFTTLAGQPRNYLGRLNADGTLDTGFDPGASNFVHCLAVQADNRILVGGFFTNLAGQPREHLGRLHADGSLDNSFDPGPDAAVYSLALQANGRILVGGAFANLAGQPRARIGRLEPDGTLDMGFVPDANGTVRTLALQSDGRILAGGDFTTLGGQSRNRIGRLINNDPVNEALAFDGSSLSWLRAGGGPEVWRSSFAASTNGQAWVELESGERTPDGWQLNGLAVPTNFTIRARGFIAGASEGSCSWFVETALGPALITAQPISRTNFPATPASFICPATGNGPLSHQWYKDDLPLEDGGNISGAHTPFLALSNVFGADAGLYSAVITNSLGSVTSSVAVLNVRDPWITNQPAGRIASPGQSATLSVVALGSSLIYQWQKDGAVLADGTNSSLVFTNLQAADAGYYSVVVSNSFGSVTSVVALLTVNAATADAFNPTVDSEVFAMAVQTDGKILIGGNFFSINSLTRTRLARLKSDGTIDPTFSAGAAASDSVYSISVQPDGKILATGWFTNLAGQSRRYIGRLNAAGSLDTAFNASASGGASFPGIYAALLQPDGKIVVGGDFRSLGGFSRTNLGRLNPNGTLDTNFTARADGIVYSLALQPDGKIVTGGEFTNLCGQLAPRIGRLNADGTLDTNFNSSANDIPLSLLIQPDGKIVAGGPFTNLSGQARSRIGRLLPDGTADASFNPGASGIVRSLALQANGHILVGGAFATLGGQSRTNIGRLRPDGKLDPTFNPGVSAGAAVVYGMTVQPDGKILVGGRLGTLAGQARSRIGRLNNTEPASENLSFDGASINWVRGGTGPEIGRASFDFSTNGINWANLGSGERIAGGWQLSGLDLPADASIRARGDVTGGRYSSSTWFLESMLNVEINAPPLILEDNGHFGFSTNRFGFDVAGLTMRGVIVDGSTNLKTWNPLWTNLLGNGPVYFSDGGSTNLPRRFYRARLQ